MSIKENFLQVDIWRGREAGHYDRFAVPQRANQTVLDVVTYVQRELAPALAYRFACRVGMCGSCAMTVNGRPRWTCRTHVSKIQKTGSGPVDLRIAPLANLPVVRDLVVDMTPFFEKWQKAQGRFHPTKTRQVPPERIDPASPARRQADAGIECINCAVCYAACDVVRWNPDYLGPAALNRAWTLVQDSRDEASSTRLAAISQEGGCYDCHSQQGCSTHCPKSLNPTAAIAGLKRAGLKRTGLAARFLKPR